MNATQEKNQLTQKSAPTLSPQEESSTGTRKRSPKRKDYRREGVIALILADASVGAAEYVENYDAGRGGE